MTTITQRQARVSAYFDHITDDAPRQFKDIGKVQQQVQKPRNRKLCDDLQVAIRRSGLKDGMTISFHHAFRGGDLTINLVMQVIAEMGFRNLTLASSSLSACHSPLVEHIRHGVIRKIYTSGIRGPLAEAISVVN